MRKSLSEKLADLANPEPEDVDPEAIDDGEGFSQSDEDQEQARAHYVDVGRSQLRRTDPELDTVKYKGQRISRGKINGYQSLPDDPQSDAASESDNDALSLGMRPAQFASPGDSDRGDSGDNSPSIDDQVDSVNDTEGSDEEQMPIDNDEHSDRAEVKKILDSEHAAMASRLKEDQKDDISKGRTVQAQMAIWEDLLDIRITVQKILSATNAGRTSTDEDKEALRALIQEIQLLRQRLSGGSESIPKKRRLEELDESTEELDNALRQERESILTKWSRKVQLSSGQRVLQQQFKSLNQSAAQQVHTVLADMDRLIERTYVNRTSLKVNDEIPAESREIFDDTDFYRLLLRDLVERRMADSSIAQNIDFKVNKVHAKKHVDTKASKGRKLRYHVQEKIQGFDAPRHVFQWSDEQAEELFSNLFGKGISMDEAVPADKEQDEEPLVDEEFALFA